MTKVIEAIYSHGVLQPLEALELAEKQRVRLTIETVAGQLEKERDVAFADFLDGVKGMKFRSNGSLPTRDELHDRP